MRHAQFSEPYRAEYRNISVKFQEERFKIRKNMYIYIYIYIYIYTHTYIQGVTGGTDQTSGECSLGQTIPI